MLTTFRVDLSMMNQDDDFRRVVGPSGPVYIISYSISLTLSTTGWIVEAASLGKVLSSRSVGYS